MSVNEDTHLESTSSFDTADLSASLEQETKEHLFDHETDAINDERDENNDERDENNDERDSSIDTADLGAEQEQQEQQAGSQSQAFNPETGEINWDCPCLGGMAHGTCGEQFKSAFSCFVYSEEEPKGMDCVSVFKDMQECFRANPEEYASELDDEEEKDEEDGDDEDKSDDESDVESDGNVTDIEDLSNADQKPRDGEP
ncbi:Oxidoreductase [Coemansia sp. RSA 1972]|nr:Oxidoreductase [Coemansia sp. RSA 1972]